MISKTILAGAAIAGLLGGAFGRLAQVEATGKAGVSLTEMGRKKDKNDVHNCKGKNTCKGKGGCATHKNACAGQNTCKERGGCYRKATPIPSN
jgi:hypothetical protein